MAHGKSISIPRLINSGSTQMSVSVCSQRSGKWYLSNEHCVRRKSQLKNTFQQRPSRGYESSGQLSSGPHPRTSLFARIDKEQERMENEETLRYEGGRGHKEMKAVKRSNFLAQGKPFPSHAPSPLLRTPPSPGHSDENICSWMCTSLSPLATAGCLATFFIFLLYSMSQTQLSMPSVRNKQEHSGAFLPTGQRVPRLCAGIVSRTDFVLICYAGCLVLRWGLAISPLC